MFGNREEVLSGPGGQSQSRRLLKEKKKKASYYSQSPEMSRHPWETRAMRENTGHAGKVPRLCALKEQNIALYGEKPFPVSVVHAERGMG